MLRGQASEPENVNPQPKPTIHYKRLVGPIHRPDIYRRSCQIYSSQTMPSTQPKEPEARNSSPSPSPHHHHPNPPVISSTTTLIFFIILILAFFPGIFHYLWAVPLHLVFGSGSGFKSSPTSHSHLRHNPADSYSSDFNSKTMWYQKQFSLPSRARGSYLITDDVLRELPQIGEYKVGLLNLFIQHTSCALSLNENWDPVGNHVTHYLTTNLALLFSFMNFLSPHCISK